MKLLFISCLVVSLLAVVVCHQRNRNSRRNSKSCFPRERYKYLFYSLKRCEQELDFCRSRIAGYGGPTCLESTCTHCSNTGELTLDLTTGDVIGTLTNATVLSMAAPSSGPYASGDCNYQARVKVTFQPETSICCTNLLRIDMEFGMTKTGHLFNFAADPTSVGLDIDSGSPPAPHDTEVHGENEAMVRHASDVEVGDDGEDLTCSYTTWTNMPNTTRATIWLAHKYFRMKDNGDFEYNFEDCATCPFDAAEEERDMYLSFNRVNLEGSDHTGHGVCSVKLSWICNVEDTNV